MVDTCANTSAQCTLWGILSLLTGVLVLLKTRQRLLAYVAHLGCEYVGPEVCSRRLEARNTSPIARGRVKCTPRPAERVWRVRNRCRGKSKRVE